MLFSDVRGSTSMAERLDPEEWTDVMNDAYEHLITPVYRYEGTVARLMGDAILAFFGAPRAHEDDPQRAVMAGLEIVGSIAPFRDRLARERDLDLNVRVGINTGPVVVGEVGSDLRREYTAMGDAVNVAARMEQTAEPGTVQITEDTYRLVHDLFDVEPLGGVELKGKSRPVHSYRVRGRLAPPWKVRAARPLEAALIGRDREIGVIGSILRDEHHARGSERDATHAPDPRRLQPAPARPVTGRQLHHRDHTRAEPSRVHRPGEIRPAFLGGVRCDGYRQVLPDPCRPRRPHQLQ